MLKKNTVFEWTPNHQEAFENIKESIVNAPILAQFIPGEPITIRPDFSSIGIGGVVLQGLSQNQKPLLFYGRKLSPAETRYSTIEGECLAIIEGFDKARLFILPSTSITVITDHSN